MKHIKHLLLLVLCAFPFVASAQVATTVGSNLTAWSGQSGSTNNNNWNNMMNNRGGTAGAAKADFGNCNSLILRCAQPKCGGCTTMDIARPIVEGCVNSNASCKKYGADLIEFMAAQMVATANQKAQAAAAAQQAQAAQQAAAANNAQMQQMQAQMQQMQQQNAALMQQTQNLQASLEQQSAAAAQDRAQLAAAQATVNEVKNPDNGLTASQNDAITRGVSDEVMMRNVVSGEILAKIEDAERAMNSLETAMKTAFAYARCDTRGNNCSGPKRVKRFKQLANEFIEPYDAVIDATYDALEMAMAVGVDVNDVLMMLNGACNRWARFMCSKVPSDNTNEAKKWENYDKDTCVNNKSIKTQYTVGNKSCYEGTRIPPEDSTLCTLSSFLNDGDELPRVWGSLGESDDGEYEERVGCASSALDSLAIFGRRNSARTGMALTLDVLERMINQDAPEYIGSSNNSRYARYSDTSGFGQTKYCGLTQNGYNKLLAAINNKQLPNNICVPYRALGGMARLDDKIVNGSGAGASYETEISYANSQYACESMQGYICSGNDECGSDYTGEGCSVEWECDNTDCKCNVKGGCHYDGQVIKKSKNTSVSAALAPLGGGSQSLGLMLTHMV